MGQGKKFGFHRENQVIVVQKELQPGENITLRIEYDGKIDERICYLDISDKEYDHAYWLDKKWRFGKRSAFVENGYTLLLPECLWYPVAVPPVNLKIFVCHGEEFYDL